jgi:hypothetical protein
VPASVRNTVDMARAYFGPGFVRGVLGVSRTTLLATLDGAAITGDDPSISRGRDDLFYTAATDERNVDHHFAVPLATVAGQPPPVAVALLLRDPTSGLLSGGIDSVRKLEAIQGPPCPPSIDKER